MREREGKMGRERVARLLLPWGRRWGGRLRAIIDDRDIGFNGWGGGRDLSRGGRFSTWAWFLFKEAHRKGIGSESRHSLVMCCHR